MNDSLGEPPDGRRRARGWIATALIVVFALVSGSAALREFVTNKVRVGNLGVITQRFNAELVPLKERLPSRGTVGFLSDSKDSLAYALAQYNLAPLIVTRNPEQAVVVGHFQDAAAAARFLERRKRYRRVPRHADLHAIVVPR